ncbi:hypothetical protein UFOVP328_400 [uncultured Caudovirales phage]|uniref:Uncharacterized protein n=1 Tax=uncultured Caudovirales phage TaxID=2100421 RepID=A0A6J5LYS0_9CAUD|nr:hypothetical protein UFOVP328_400 [uncultured Caudovirales phage]
MNISWVLSNGLIPDPELDLQQLKDIGPFWGGWQTWRSCGTDNVICNDFDRAQSLIARKFNEGCNFYIPNNIYQSLDHPSRVKLYDGTTNLDLDNKEEIIAMHLAASQSDIVLLLGFDWQPKTKQADRLQEHLAQNYRNLIRQVMSENSLVQWVLIDHKSKLMLEIQDLPNLTQDTLKSVLKMLSS